MRSTRTSPAFIPRNDRRAVLAAIRRREWLLQMLALGAAGCGREDRKGLSTWQPDPLLFTDELWLEDDR